MCLLNFHMLPKHCLCFLYIETLALSQRSRKWSCCEGSWGRMSSILSRNCVSVSSCFWLRSPTRPLIFSVELS
uniref:Uncharacterized protein n=1 Tax=Anguilla anguilla TaxID=7936 RepID=A0A0E9SCE8_ANGAN